MMCAGDRAAKAGYQLIDDFCPAGCRMDRMLRMAEQGAPDEDFRRRFPGMDIGTIRVCRLIVNGKTADFRQNTSKAGPALPNKLSRARREWLIRQLMSGADRYAVQTAYRIGNSVMHELACEARKRRKKEG